MSKKHNMEHVIDAISEVVRENNLDSKQLGYVFKRVQDDLGQRKSQELVGLSQEELFHFLEMAFRIDPVTGLQMMTLYETAVTLDEFIDILAADLNYHKRHIVIQHGEHKGRQVSISKHLAHMLLLHLSVRRRGYLFETNDGARFSKQRIQMIMEEVSKEAKTTIEVTPRVLRHTHTTTVIEDQNLEKLRQIFLESPYGRYQMQDLYISGL